MLAIFQTNNEAKGFVFESEISEATISNSLTSQEPFPSFWSEFRKSVIESDFKN